MSDLDYKPTAVWDEIIAKQYQEDQDLITVVRNQKDRFVSHHYIPLKYNPFPHLYKIREHQKALNLVGCFPNSNIDFGVGNGVGKTTGNAGPSLMGLQGRTGNTLELELEKTKAELFRTQKRLEQSTLDIMDNLDQINRARHQVELKQLEINRLEKKAEEQGLTLNDYIESNIRLEAQRLRPCNCLAKTEIACESFRQSTNQTLIRWGTACLILLAIITYYMYPKF